MTPSPSLSSRPSFVSPTPSSSLTTQPITSPSHAHELHELTVISIIASPFSNTGIATIIIYYTFSFSPQRAASRGEYHGHAEAKTHTTSACFFRSFRQMSITKSNSTPSTPLLLSLLSFLLILWLSSIASAFSALHSILSSIVSPFSTSLLFFFSEALGLLPFFLLASSVHLSELFI